jgi:hypothetical protein
MTCAPKIRLLNGPEPTRAHKAAAVSGIRRAFVAQIWVGVRLVANRYHTESKIDSAYISQKPTTNPTMPQAQCFRAVPASFASITNRPAARMATDIRICITKRGVLSSLNCLDRVFAGLR